MAKRVDYQNPNNDLEDVHERRTAQIRAWAKADQVAADKGRGLIESAEAVEDDWAAIESEPQVEPEAQPEPQAADPEPEGEETPEDVEKATPAKKAAAKKAAAPAKEASSKE